MEDMSISSIDKYRKDLEDRLDNTFFEIEVCGHVALIGKMGYIEWLVKEREMLVGIPPSLGSDNIKK